MLPNANFRITKTNCCWVFLAASSEARHLYDIISAVDVLRKKGVPDKNIFIFVDHPTAQLHLNLFNITKNIFHADSLEQQISAAKGFEIVLLFVTGHGNEKGIVTSTGVILNPEKVFFSLRQCPDIKCGAIVLGQCFGGVFNFHHASNKPELCVVGATNLHMSLSGDVTLPTPIGTNNPAFSLSTWSANVFLFCFFLWISNPQDVDGDGTFSLIDAYKFAGVNANTHLRNVKSALSFQADAWLWQQKVILQQPQLSPLQKQSIKQQIDEKLTLLHLHQEPWCKISTDGSHPISTM